jgi:hypothetical protein
VTPLVFYKLENLSSNSFGSSRPTEMRISSSVKPIFFLV